MTTSGSRNKNFIPSLAILGAVLLPFIVYMIGHVITHADATANPNGGANIGLGIQFLVALMISCVFSLSVITASIIKMIANRHTR